MATLTALELMKALVRGASSETDDTLETYIEIAADEVDLTEWGATLYPRAVALVAGHYLQSFSDAGGGGGAAAGGVTSQKDGDLSRSYSAPSTSTSDSGWATTQAGMMYLHLRRRHIPGITYDVLTSDYQGFP